MASINMTITNAGLDWIASALFGGAFSQILYFAVGTGSTAPTVNDTKLGAEVYRNVFQSWNNASTHGEIHMFGFIDLAYANVSIAEVGLFGTSDSAIATTSANTGLLIMRALYTQKKTNQQTITLDFDISF